MGAPFAKFFLVKNRIKDFPNTAHWVWHSSTENWWLRLILHVYEQVFQNKSIFFHIRAWGSRSFWNFNAYVPIKDLAKKNVFYGRLTSRSRKCLMELACPEEISDIIKTRLFIRTLAIETLEQAKCHKMITCHHFWTFVENRNEIKLKEILKYVSWYLFLNFTFSKLSFNLRRNDTIKTIFWVLEFVCILGFIFYGFSCAKTDLHNKYMI